MTFGALIRERLPVLQAAAESMMVESCLIQRSTGTTVDDEGREVTTYRTIYAGICRIRSFRPYPEDRETGASTSTSQMYDHHSPAATRIPHLLTVGAVTEWDGPVRNGDMLTRTTPGRASEVYRLETEHDITYQTAQRLVGRLITGGAWA